MNTSLDIQLEFLDYKIGDYNTKYQGYYMGLYNNRIMLIYLDDTSIDYRNHFSVEKYMNWLMHIKNIDIEYKISNELEFKYILRNIYKSQFLEILFTKQYFIIDNNKIYDYRDCEIKSLDSLPNVTKQCYLKTILVKYL